MYTNKSAPIFWTKSVFDCPALAFNLCAPDQRAHFLLLLCLRGAHVLDFCFFSAAQSDDISLFAHLIDGRGGASARAFRTPKANTFMHGWISEQ